ncbi:protein phosphatase 2C domain-containing protein [Neomegalonema sp.]|uniref:protein phosphatase 2C domain-containing protein n=1 Tax=Neomegalonema sp. TaxID=2039713 RepID=UPI002638B2A9|nr:protein phosphatase 2C domain-containing protein [Neomegalonema sp.]MDD2867779.1 protein phosphatase 2C domain-containing protein [Neomegalonema sp.]
MNHQASNEKAVWTSFDRLAHMLSDLDWPPAAEGEHSFHGLNLDERRILRLLMLAPERRKEAALPCAPAPAAEPPPPPEPIPPLLAQDREATSLAPAPLAPVPEAAASGPTPPAGAPDPAGPLPSFAEPEAPPASGAMASPAPEIQPPSPREEPPPAQIPDLQPPPAMVAPPPPTTLEAFAHAPRKPLLQQPPSLQRQAFDAGGLEPGRRSLPAKQISLSLPNARAGEPYEALLNDHLGEWRDEGGPLKDPRFMGSGGAGGSGLELDSATGRLSGRPGASGDFTLRIAGRHRDRPCEVTASLAVIPDPKSLWVYRDSDRNAPHWRPDEEAQRIDSGPLFGLGASKRGRSHARDGGFRDDAFNILSVSPEGWTLGVVADGAGSARMARRGAALAVETMSRTLPPLLREHVEPHLSDLLPRAAAKELQAADHLHQRMTHAFTTAAHAAVSAIHAEAKEAGDSVSAYATTLVASAALRTPQGWLIAAFAIGDGGAVILDAPTGHVTPLTRPDSGDFAGQTRFLHMTEFREPELLARRVAVTLLPDFTALMLMTDGITDPKFPTETDFADPARWTAFWRHDLTKSVNVSPEDPEAGSRLLDWLDFWSPGNHDDRTIVILTPRREPSA